MLYTDDKFIENWVIIFWASVHLVDILSQDLTKSQTLEIRVQICIIALISVRHLNSSTTVMPVKFQSDSIIITSNLAASKIVVRRLTA